MVISRIEGVGRERSVCLVRGRTGMVLEVGEEGV